MIADRHLFLPLGGSVVIRVSGSAPSDVQLDTPAPYIGVIGSRRRWTMVLQDLHAKGLPDEALARIHAPIGLELQAETPEEIAVSIMAEITLLRRGGTGKPMMDE